MQYLLSANTIRNDRTQIIYFYSPDDPFHQYTLSLLAQIELNNPELPFFAIDVLQFHKLIKRFKIKHVPVVAVVHDQKIVKKIFGMMEYHVLVNFFAEKATFDQLSILKPQNIFNSKRRFVKHPVLTLPTNRIMRKGKMKTLAETPQAKQKEAPTVADQIWNDIKHVKVEMFALPPKKVEDLCQVVPGEPSKVYLTSTISAFLPALETALQGKYIVDRNEHYITVAIDTDRD